MPGGERRLGRRGRTVSCRKSSIGRWPRESRAPRCRVVRSARDEDRRGDEHTEEHCHPTHRPRVQAASAFSRARLRRATRCRSTTNRIAAPMRIACSGRRSPATRPTTIAIASAATMPTVEPSQVPNRPCSVASVMVASIVLSPELGQHEQAADGEDHRSVGLVEPLLVVLVEIVAAQRPQREPDERDTRHRLDRAIGQRVADHGADAHRHEMHDAGRDGDADEHGHRGVARREPERHQLALVTELGDEDHAEADEECFEHLRWPGPAARPSLSGTRRRKSR